MKGKTCICMKTVAPHSCAQALAGASTSTTLPVTGATGTILMVGLEEEEEERRALTTMNAATATSATTATATTTAMMTTAPPEAGATGAAPAAPGALLAEERSGER